MTFLNNYDGQFYKILAPDLQMCPDRYKYAVGALTPTCLLFHFHYLMMPFYGRQYYFSECGLLNLWGPCG